MVLLKCALILVCVVLHSSDAEDTLRQVNLLYRHGARSPGEIYPKDINQEDSWPDGLGWLTNNGKTEEYELGQYLKERYGDFLNTSYYNNDQIYIKSSAIPRCLMSAYSVLAGLFPPGPAQLWNPDLKWQPIPVQTRPKKEDNKLALGASCPEYFKLLGEVFNSKEVQEMNEKYKDFLQQLSNDTGYENMKVTDVWKVSDALTSEEAQNLTWNDWAMESGVWDTIVEINAYTWGLLYNTNTMARLKGGPLLGEIVANLEGATNSTPKVYMYSAHDTTVASVLRAMHMFDAHQPPFASVLMVELHYIESKYVVKTFYRNDTNRDPYELVPKGCAKLCPLTDFVKLTKDSVPVDWKKECNTKSQVDWTQLNPAQKPTDAKPLSNGAVAGIALGGIFVGVIVTVLIVLAIRTYSKRSFSSLNS